MLNPTSANAPEPLFSWPVRIYYEDTDAGGVVYHASYIKFMERARTEFLRALGFELPALQREPGLVFAIRSLTIDYHRPARLDDRLEVTVAFESVRPASLLFIQTIRRDGERLCSGKVRVAALSADRFRPMVIPDLMQARLAAYCLE